MVTFLRQSTIHTAGLLVGAVLTLAFAGEARAACGDYLHAPAVRAEPSSIPHPPPAKPCNGPMCEQHRDAPIAPPGADDPSRLDTACALAPQAPTWTHAGASRVLESHSTAFSAISREIFHPPR